QQKRIRANIIWQCLAIGAVLLVLAFVGWGIRNRITRLLKSVTHNLTNANDALFLGARQIADASHSLAGGASEQAASLEQTSASLEEGSSMVKRNAQNAQGAKEFTTQTRKTTDLSATSTREMSQAMQSIKSASAEMREAMNGIKAASADVSKIIKTIDEIAF